MYKKVKKLTAVRSGERGMKIIENRRGEILTESGKIKKKWREYVEELYGKEDKPKELKIEKEQN